MSFFHNQFESRTITTGDGVKHRQNRFLCPVHGYFDLFVFPDAFIEHADCEKVEHSHDIHLKPTPKKAA